MSTTKKPSQHPDAGTPELKDLEQYCLKLSNDDANRLIGWISGEIYNSPQVAAMVAKFKEFHEKQAARREKEGGEQ